MDRRFGAPKSHMLKAIPSVTGVSVDTTSGQWWGHEGGAHVLGLVPCKERPEIAQAFSLPREDPAGTQSSVNQEEICQEPCWCLHLRLPSSSRNKYLLFKPLSMVFCSRSLSGNTVNLNIPASLSVWSSWSNLLIQPGCLNFRLL